LNSYKAIRRSFSGDQLRMARELRRMTQGDVARRTQQHRSGEGVTAAAISQYERGDAVPSEETIEALIAVLGVDPHFLIESQVDLEADIPAFFRSLRSTPARERKRARAVVQLVHRLSAAVAKHVELPTVDVPYIPCDPFASATRRRASAERAAADVRAAWGIQPGPIDNMVSAIEQHGIPCARLQLEGERIDAFSVPFSDRPVVVLAADKQKWDRSRFDAAHELGHVVMHSDVAGVVEAEKQANEFAAALLMPARDITDELPARADWHRLLGLKDTWGTSIAALLYRARTLKVMSEHTYVNATKVMAARGWRRHEPLNRAAEAPQLLHDALNRAARRGVDIEQLRQEAAIPSDLFEEVLAVISDDGIE
jgi:Zn-dependent peptidase ImmA (M78 family)/transcriptional regulator with XRE-family HTH domain